MSDYIIKPLETTSEIEGRGYVHYTAWQETFAGMVDEAYLRQMSMEQCLEIGYRIRESVLIAKDREKVIGFVVYGGYRDEPASGYGEVYALFVLKEYQGKKIGYRLMQAAIERLSAYQSIVLWVLKDNHKTIRFYEQYGFHFDGAEKELLLGTPVLERRMVYQFKR